MTLRRAALYIGGASLLGAWFSSAASLSLFRHTNPPVVLDAEQSASGIEDLAAQVQRQSRRLRERLVARSVPGTPLRNPFAFREVAPRSVVSTAPRAQTPLVVPTAAEPPEPLLRLVGMAEDASGQGVVRTAVLVTAADELIMVTLGEAVLQRYKVTGISAAAVELADLASGRTRRLVLEAP